MAGVREAWMPEPIRPTSTERGAVAPRSSRAELNRTSAGCMASPVRHPPRRARGARRAQPVVLRLAHRLGGEVAEVIELDAIGLPRAERRERRDDRDAERERADLERDTARAGRGHGR